MTHVQSPADGKRVARPVMVVTGAAGGMGRAICRQMGHRFDLFLMDSEGSALEAFASDLRDEGYFVCSMLAGDIASADYCQKAAQAAAALGPIEALVHTAAVSPGNADWRTILKVDIEGTIHVLTAFEAGLEPGSAAVVIASSAGHQVRPDARIDAIMGLSPAAMLADRLAGILPETVGSADEGDWRMAAYSLAKRENIRLCERLAPAWGRRGVRILSISPGLIWTPMGRRAAENSERSRTFLASTPVARWGTSLDIAALVAFLLSDQGSFITGTDILIDGGLTSAVRQAVDFGQS